MDGAQKSMAKAKTLWSAFCSRVCSGDSNACSPTLESESDSRMGPPELVFALASRALWPQKQRRGAQRAPRWGTQSFTFRGSAKPVRDGHNTALAACGESQNPRKTVAQGLKPVVSYRLFTARLKLKPCPFKTWLSPQAVR